MQQPATATEPETARLRILLADDEPAILRVLQLAFRDHDTVAVTSGEQAVALLAAQPFDVIVSDHDMGELTGVDVLWYAACVQPEARRILFSGVSPAAVREHLRTGVVARLVPKPSFGTLCRAVADEAGGR